MSEEATKKAKHDPLDQELLKQIRDDYRYHESYWHDNYEEAEKDMRFAAAEPPSDFVEDRKNRPCIWPDEISQYVKQTNNNRRQNKRSIKISPRSADAKDTDAEHRQAYIRGIEYASKAQAIYTAGFESAVECAFGFWRVTTRVTGPKGEQEPRIAPIPNWASVLPDPDCKEPDFSDQMRCFVLDSMRETRFAEKYPNAKKKSFTPDDRQEATGWFLGDKITIAEYWVLEKSTKKDGEERHKVTQYITNGVEILEENEWIGSWIPIICVLGEEKWVRNSGTSKRKFLSLIRRSRDLQQLLAYLCSQMCEEFGMSPRAPLQGWKGMFEEKLHKLIHKIPMAYVEYTLPTDWNPQWGPPQLPTRAAFEPQIQSYLAAYEQIRRGIQASVGIAPLPTAAQRQNEKSGIALEKIQNQEATGAFHFLDNWTRALGNTGMQINELITKLAELDSLPQQLLGKDQKDEDMLLKVAPRAGLPPSEGLDPESEHLQESDYFFAHRGQFEVTVSDGPNYQSQREEASDFADTLLGVLPKLPIPPQVLQEVMAIAVRLKNIGTFGDEIADLLSPPQNQDIPPQAKAAIAQMQGQLQMAQAELQKLQMEKLGKVTEIQGKMALAQQEGEVRMAEADKDRETKMAVAEITALKERVGAAEDMMKQLHQQAHDLALMVQEHQHAKELAAQSHQQALEQGVQQAALEPPPAQAAQ